MNEPPTCCCGSPPSPHQLAGKPNDTHTDSGPEPNTRRGLIARTFAVFAAEQVDGTTITHPDAEGDLHRDSATRIEVADDILMAWLDILDCTMDDLIEPVAAAQPAKPKTAAGGEAGIGALRPKRARIT